MPNGDEKVIGELVKRMNESSIRIRDLESRIDKLERDLALAQEDAARAAEDLKLSIDGISKKLSQAFTALEEIRAELTKLRGGLEGAATKVEVKELEKFLELISPMTTQFITKGELERILEEKLKKI